jgi:hypothetical protein
MLTLPGQSVVTSTFSECLCTIRQLFSFPAREFKWYRDKRRTHMPGTKCQRLSETTAAFAAAEGKLIFQSIPKRWLRADMLAA